MATDPMETDERDRLLDRLVTEYLEAVEAGHRPDRGEWLARHLELAPDLAAFFADQDWLEWLAAPLRGVARAALPDGCGRDDPVSREGQAVCSEQGGGPAVTPRR